MPTLEPWWRVVTPRKEVREGRSFNPDEFAIALEQVVSGKAPEDYSNPRQFFERTVLTRALREHVGMVLRRLAGETADTAPVLTLITQFGGGKTHTLTALYHLANLGPEAASLRGMDGLLKSSRLDSIPKAKVAVFVGNAWDPREGRETPWIDVARQLAGAEGVAALGKSAETTPPGTEALASLFDAAGGTVLILFDEVLNFVNRHRGMAEPFHAFIQNLTVAASGHPHCAMVVSLPRSQVEMTDWDLEWQEKITKVVRRVAKDLIANDETEIGEVVRRRLFEDIGDEAASQAVAKTFADWCFERRDRLPPEWTAIDSAATEKKAREFLRDRFASCFPFHPATLSVFQRKWQALPQYQQTRGTLAMLAQWVARAYRSGFTEARLEPLITLGSAPLGEPEFRSVVLGQLGESRLIAAIDADITSQQPLSHSRVLDADTKGPLRDIHRRVATVILFESSGGQAEKVAHLPELRFALGEPGIDTTSIDNAAIALDTRAFFIRKVGTDGFRIGYKPKLNKVVNDRRASLDENEIHAEMRRLIEREFERTPQRARESTVTLPVVRFPKESSDIPDSPRLTLVIADPDWEWSRDGGIRERVADWTRTRGKDNRLYPGAIVWCLRRPGRDLREKVELLLAWRRVSREVSDGTLGSEFERSDLADIRAKATDAEEVARDEVWAAYRYVALADNSESDGLKVIDLGAGHSNDDDSLCARVVAAMRSGGLFNEEIGAGYLDRHWPAALATAGSWPLSSLRQAFVNASGEFTRLPDTERVLRKKIVEFVERGELGLASGHRAGGTYDRVWFEENVPGDEVAFEADVFLLRKVTAQALKVPPEEPAVSVTEPVSEQAGASAQSTMVPDDATHEQAGDAKRVLRIHGSITPEVWNRFGTRILPKVRSGSDLKLTVDLSVEVDAAHGRQLELDLRQSIDDMGLSDFEIES
jgi:hypothetical protein